MLRSRVSPEFHGVSVAVTVAAGERKARPALACVLLTGPPDNVHPWPRGPDLMQTLQLCFSGQSPLCLPLCPAEKA